MAILFHSEFSIAQRKDTLESGETMTSSLTLKRDYVYEIAFIAPTVESETRNAAALYFGDAAEIAQEHGARPLMTFNVTDIEHGDIDARYIVLIEWPSLESVRSLRGHEPSARRRQDLEVSDVRFALFRVLEDTSIKFSGDGVYEFASFWMNRHNANLMPRYFEGMGPVVRLARPQSLVRTEVIKTRSPYDLRPDTVNLLRWDGGPEAREQIFQSQEFRDNGYMRALALDRILTVMVRPGHGS